MDDCGRNICKAPLLVGGYFLPADFQGSALPAVHRPAQLLTSIPALTNRLPPKPDGVIGLRRRVAMVPSRNVARRPFILSGGTGIRTRWEHNWKDQRGGSQPARQMAFQRLAPIFHRASPVAQAHYSPSFFSPLATIVSAPSGNSRCSFSASCVGQADSMCAT